MSEVRINFFVYFNLLFLAYFCFGTLIYPFLPFLSFYLRALVKYVFSQTPYAPCMRHLFYTCVLACTRCFSAGDCTSIIKEYILNLKRIIRHACIKFKKNSSFHFVFTSFIKYSVSLEKSGFRLIVICHEVEHSQHLCVFSRFLISRTLLHEFPHAMNDFPPPDPKFLNSSFGISHNPTPAFVTAPYDTQNPILPKKVSTKFNKLRKLWTSYFCCIISPPNLPDINILHDKFDHNNKVKPGPTPLVMNYGYFEDRDKQVASDFQELANENRVSKLEFHREA